MTKGVRPFFRSLRSLRYLFRALRFDFLRGRSFAGLLAAASWRREAVFSGRGKIQFLSFRAPTRSGRGISLFLGFNPREIPRFAQNDKINYFFRSLSSVFQKRDVSRPTANPVGTSISEGNAGTSALVWIVFAFVVRLEQLL